MAPSRSGPAYAEARAGTRGADRSPYLQGLTAAVLRKTIEDYGLQPVASTVIGRGLRDRASGAGSGSASGTGAVAVAVSNGAAPPRT